MLNREVIYFFKKNPIFGSINLTDKAIQKLLVNLEVYEFSKHTILYKKDQLANYVYLVLSGEVGIFSFKESFSTLEIEKAIENAEILSIHRKGSIFGEVSFLAGETHSSTAITLTKSKIGFIPGNVFLELLNTNPPFAREMIRLLSSRFREKIGKEHSLHMGKIISCLYPEMPKRIIFMIRSISYIAKKELGELIAVLYFQLGLKNDEENQKNFEFLFDHFEHEDVYDYVEKISKKEKVLLLNASRILKKEIQETKIIDFLSTLKKIFSFILMEIPSFDYPISKILLRNTDVVLFFQRFDMTSFAIKELYIEQMSDQNLIQKDKVIYVFEKSPKKKIYTTYQNWQYSVLFAYFYS